MTRLAMLGLVSCLAGTTACDAGVDVEGPPAARARGGTATTGGWGCRGCGYTNSPSFGPYPLDRFTVSEVAEHSPLKLGGLEDPAGVRYQARVDGQQFVAQTPAGDVEGVGLLGWTIVFSSAVGELEVHVTAFENHDDWVAEEDIPTYGLAYFDPTDPDSPLLNVCPGLTPDDTSVVLIADELYDVSLRTVIPQQPGWVTMACRGHALAKLKFLGHDPNDMYGSSWEQRQTALKMITADYCGTGQPFTAFGQPLMWIDELLNFPEHELPPGGVVEARWSEDGALCLDEPRLVGRWEVEDQCTIPTCDGDPSLGGARWVSLLPPAP